MTPTEYVCIWKPTLVCLKLKASDLAPEHNMPIGWFRHTLRVVDKYEKDPAWVGQVNRDSEWAVAYRGTRAEAAIPIVKEGLKTSAVDHDAQKQKDQVANSPGVYVATNCQNSSYPRYTRGFSVPVSVGKSEEYSLVFQCRVRPGEFTTHKSSGPAQEGEAWRFVDPRFIRPYGILLKKEA